MPSHQDEAALQALALKDEFEVTLLQGFFGRPIPFRFPIAAIPEHDRAAAILAFGDRPL
jgi:hypothetical protein